MKHQIPLPEYNDFWNNSTCYGKENFAHGARIILLREGQEGFETWVRLEDGKIIKHPKEHKPEGENINY